MQTIDCQPSCCEVPVAVQIPGNPGAAGAAGSSAFTTLTADLTLPAAAGPVVGATTVADSSWMAIGQNLFISDGVDWANFRVLTIPSATSVTLQWLDYSDDAAGTSVIGSGGKVTASGTEPVISGFATSGANANITSLTGLTTPLTRAQGGTEAATRVLAQTSLGLGQDSIISSATGLTQAITNSAAQVGTIDITIPAALPAAVGLSTFLYSAHVSVDWVGVTFAASQIITIIIRNITAGVTIATATRNTQIHTTATFPTIDYHIPFVQNATAAPGEHIQIQISVSTVNSAGTFSVVAGSLCAVPLRKS